MTATVSVTRDGEDRLLAVVHRDGEETEVELAEADLYEVRAQVIELLGEDAEVAWVFPDDDMAMSLNDESTGSWRVTTWHGSSFAVDLDASPRWVVRTPEPQLRGGFMVVNVHPGDEQPGELLRVDQLEVGRSACLCRTYPGASQYLEPYRSTQVRMIERIGVAPTTDPVRGVVMVVGDVHGDVGWIKRLLERARDLGIDTILSVGDWGIGPFSGDRGGAPFERKVERIAKKNGVTVFVVPGNHENYDTIGRLESRSDGWSELSPNVRVAPRGHRWRWAGVRFGALGGAFSVDWRLRKAGRDWWPDLEEVQREDVEWLGDDPLDVLVTHDVPAGIPVGPGGLFQPYPLPEADVARAQVSRDLLLEAVRRTRPEAVFCGHWHHRLRTLLELPAGTRGGRETVAERNGIAVTDATSADHVRVEVLDMEQTDVNFVLLDLSDMSIIEQRTVEARSRNGE
jgi:hypothetical protein